MMETLTPGMALIRQILAAPPVYSFEGVYTPPILENEDETPVKGEKSRGSRSRTEKKAPVELTQEQRDAFNGGYDVEAMNKHWVLCPMGENVYFVHLQDNVADEERVIFRSRRAFELMHENKPTAIMGDKGLIQLTYATRWIKDINRREAKGVTFCPLTQGEKIPKEYEGYFNLWQGFSVKPAKNAGEFDIFLDHIRNHVCDGVEKHYKWVVAWMAHMVQKPRERTGLALILRGEMGTGKSILGDVLGSFFKDNYRLVSDGRYMTGNFNAHMRTCLLLQSDEATWAGDKSSEGALKSLITTGRHMVESKGIDAAFKHNYVHVIMTSNEKWVVPAGSKERRMVVLDVNSNVIQNREYFGNMLNQLDNGGREALLYYLLHFDLKSVDLFDTPKTTALLEQKLETASPFMEFFYDVLRDGYITQGESSDWPKSINCAKLYGLYAEWSERRKRGRPLSTNNFGSELKKIMGDKLLRKRSSWGDRLWSYELPPLEEARHNFEAYYNQPIIWDELNEEAEREPY